jgi:hypothetical protein
MSGGRVEANSVPYVVLDIENRGGPQEMPRPRSCCERVTEKAKYVAGSVWNAFKELFRSHNEPYKRAEGLFYKAADDENQNFFQKPIERTNQSESWYVVSPYVAEFWSTVSSAAIIAVGGYYKEPLMITTGLISMVRHAIPKKWLTYLDKCSAVLAGVSLIRCYAAIGKEPLLVFPALVSAQWAMVSYAYSDLYYTWRHPLLHLSIASTATCFYKIAGGERAF